MKKSILLLALIALLAILLVGCSGQTTVVDEDGTTVTIDEDNQEYEGTITDDEGNTATMQGGSDLDLPEDWPADIMPVYPGGSIVHITDSEAGKMIAIGTNDDLADVAAFYQDKLANATNSSNVQVEGISMHAGEIDGSYYSVTIGNDQESDWDTTEEFSTFVIITINTY